MPLALNRFAPLTLTLFPSKAFRHVIAVHGILHIDITTRIKALCSLLGTTNAEKKNATQSFLCALTPRPAIALFCHAQAAAS